MNQRVYGDEIHIKKNPQQDQSMEKLLEYLQKRLDDQDPQKIFLAQKEELANLRDTVEECQFVVTIFISNIAQESFCFENQSLRKNFKTSNDLMEENAAKLANIQQKNKSLEKTNEELVSLSSSFDKLLAHFLVS